MTNIYDHYSCHIQGLGEIRIGQHEGPWWSPRTVHVNEDFIGTLSLHQTARQMSDRECERNHAQTGTMRTIYWELAPESGKEPVKRIVGRHFNTEWEQQTDVDRFLSCDASWTVIHKSQCEADEGVDDITEAFLMVLRTEPAYFLGAKDG